MNRPFDLIVFDWDGTLMDSARKIVRCFQAAAADVGVRVPDENAIRQIIGLGLTEALETLLPEVDPKRVGVSPSVIGSIFSFSTKPR